MAALRKGTATPLGAVFSPEETQRAVARVAEAIADRQTELGRLQGFVADNAALVSLVKRLPDEVSHEIMVPFGAAAFFPGRVIHTNELLVLLGEGYYAERSAKQTTEILQRRGLELEAQIEAMKATISDFEAEAKFFESTATEASEGLVEIREEYDEDMESNVALSEASMSDGGMPDNDREHAQIMARLDELEMEEKEAGSTSEEEDDDDDDDEDVESAGRSEDDEENEESGDALSDNNMQLSSSFGASFSGSDGNDKSHGKMQLKSALKKTGREETLRSVSHAPSAHTSHPVFPGQTSIINSEVRVPKKAVSFQGDKDMVSSLKSPIQLDQKYPAPGLKESSDLAPPCDGKILSSGQKAFTGSIVEHGDNLSASNSSSEKPISSSRPMSRFKMQKGAR